MLSLCACVFVHHWLNRCFLVHTPPLLISLYIYPLWLWPVGYFFSPHPPPHHRVFMVCLIIFLINPPFSCFLSKSFVLLLLPILFSSLNFFSRTILYRTGTVLFVSHCKFFFHFSPSPLHCPSC